MNNLKGFIYTYKKKIIISIIIALIIFIGFFINDYKKHKCIMEETIATAEQMAKGNKYYTDYITSEHILEDLFYKYMLGDIRLEKYNPKSKLNAFLFSKQYIKAKDIYKELVKKQKEKLDQEYAFNKNDLKEEYDYSKDNTEKKYDSKAENNHENSLSNEQKEEQIWQYCKDRWEYYDKLNGQYSADKYTENVFKDASIIFKITPTEAQAIWDKVDKQKLGVKN